MPIYDTLQILLLSAAASILLGIFIIYKFAGPFPVRVPWRLLTNKRLKAHYNLQVERVRAGRFFDVTCEQGHTLEMTGVDLCRRLDSIGEYILCPECVGWVKAISIIKGRSMSREQKEQQENEYAAWLDEMERWPYSEIHAGPSG